MKNWKKMLGVLLAGALVLGGCGGTKKEQAVGSKTIPELKIAISPYQDADTLRTKTEPLGKMLQAKLKEKGYEVQKITLNVGTSYNAVWGRHSVQAVLMWASFPEPPMCSATGMWMCC